MAHPAPVCRASDMDVEPVARSLARAFYEDPVWMWFLPDDATRTRRLEGVFATFTRKLYLRHGDDCYTTEDYKGGALWAPPGHETMSIRDTLAVLPAWTRAIGWRDLLRAQRGVASFDDAHPHEPHYYLAFVGVAPEAQGQGLGTALIRPVLEKCDREGMPAYLEATTVDSRRCYERLGFQTRSEERVAADGPPFFAMWRDPQG